MKINEINKICVNGNMFNNNYLEIFPKDDKNKVYRISNIYGKNGSGKSTISKGIEGDKEQKIDVRFFDYSNVEMTRSETDRIYVYNETFVDEKIKTSENGIQTIIMFGKQKELDDKIEELKKESEKLKKESLKLNAEIGSIENKKDENSYLKTQDIINSKLKNGWATRDKEIKGNMRNSTFVYRDLLNKICDNKNEKVKKEEFLKEYQKLLDTYKKTNSAQKCDVDFSKISVFSTNFPKLKLLLEKKIENPEFTEREKIILTKIKEGSQKFYENVRAEFENDNQNFCPYCFQDISNIKKDIICSINKVLNKDVDDCKNELEEMKINFEKIEEYDEQAQIIDEKIILEVNNLIGKINMQVDYLHSKINSKIDNIYVVLSDVSDEIIKLETQINELLEKLEEKKKEFNEAIEKRNVYKKNLNDINLYISWYDIKEFYELFLVQKEKYDKLISVRNENERSLTKIRSEIRKIESEKQNVRIANEKINLFLEYIFMAKDRLKIEYDESQKIYLVKTRNHDIKPKELSTGERNVIALCYFFTKILENTDSENEFKEECLIVLDDPISSFDLENKIGLYTFLRMMFNKVMKNNSMSRIINFTHSLETMTNLIKICSDIDVLFIIKELVNMNLIQFSFKKRSDYKKMLDDTYSYASIIDASQENELDDYIGNIMRRLLEAYSTFNYNKDIEQLTKDKSILEKFTTDKQKEYFENFMYRLVLNGESHTYDETKNVEFFDYISREEKIITAKSILVLLYLLDKVHLEKYFANNSIISEIQEWENEIIPK